MRFYAEKGNPVILFGAGPRTLAEAGEHNRYKKLDHNNLRRGTKIIALTGAELLKPKKQRRVKVYGQNVFLRYS